MASGTKREGTARCWAQLAPLVLSYFFLNHALKTFDNKSKVTVKLEMKQGDRRLKTTLSNKNRSWRDIDDIWRKNKQSYFHDSRRIGHNIWTDSKIQRYILIELFLECSFCDKISAYIEWS